MTNEPDQACELAHPPPEPTRPSIFDLCSQVLNLMDQPLPPKQQSKPIKPEMVSHATKFKEIFYRLRKIESQLNMVYVINKGYIKQDI